MTTPLLVTPEMDWNDPLKEQKEYETAVFTADDDTETREGILISPNRRLTYTVRAMDLRESGLLETLIHYGQGVVCWVPYWRGARYLASDLPAGSTQVPVTDARSLGFLLGEGAMLYRDFHTAEAVDVTGGLSGSAMTISATTQDWNGTSTPRDMIVPIFRGRLAPDIDLAYQTKHVKAVSLVFDVGQGLGLEGTGEPPPPTGPPPCGAPTVYQQDFEGFANTAAMLAEFPFANNSFPLATCTLDPTGGEGGGKAMKIFVPAGFQDFHSGANAHHDVTGLAHATAYCEVRCRLDSGFLTDVGWNNYDLGLFQDGGVSPGVHRTSQWQTLSFQDVPRFGVGGTTFRINLGWAFLAYFSIGHDASIWFDNLLFTAPCP